MDEKKVIDGVRKLSPLAVKLHEAFPNNWTKVNKLSYKQSGEFSSSAALGNGVELSVNHDIRVAADGFDVELVTPLGRGFARTNFAVWPGRRLEEGWPFSRGFVVADLRE